MPVHFRSCYSILPVCRPCNRSSKPYSMSSTVFSSASPRTSPEPVETRIASSNGDLNNLSAVRPVAEIAVDAAFVGQSLAITEPDDDPEIRRRYRPFLLPEEIANSDWISNLEMSTAMSMAYKDMRRVDGSRLKLLVLYGSLRERCVTLRFSLLPSLTPHELLLEAPCF